MTTEQVKTATADGEIRFSMGGPARYWIAGDFGGGTVTVRSYSPSQDDAIVLTDPAAFTANEAFILDDPYLEFSLAGATNPDLVFTAILIISRDRGA